MHNLGDRNLRKLPAAMVRIRIDTFTLIFRTDGCNVIFILFLSENAFEKGIGANVTSYLAILLIKDLLSIKYQW